MSHQPSDISLKTFRASNRPRRDWRAALKAVRALLRDKEDTTQVFAIMRALRGDAMERGAARFYATDFGRQLRESRAELLDTLADRAWLASLPADSLGRAYLDFMIRENITAEGLVEASSETGYEIANADVALYARRVRDQHDLWHVVTGYGRDGVGEACVVAFSYAQTKSLGFGAIALMAGWKFSRQFPGEGVMKAVWQAWRNGRKAAWLPGQDWRALLQQPFDVALATLNIPEAERYQRCQKAIKGTGVAAA